MEAWRLLETWDRAPGFNMALDEALLLSRDAPPTLRFYTWRPAATSLGYFQRFADVPPELRDGPLVRRLTGGGAIRHAGELTFALAADLAHPLYRGPVEPSYRRVHAAIAEALGPLGVHAVARGAHALASEDEGSFLCFHRAAPFDLVWDGAKGVGSAQRRKDGRVLHHGSIKIAPEDVERGVARLDRHAPTLTARELAERVAAACARAFGARFRTAEPTGDELAHARAREGFFGSRAFLERL